MAMIPWTTYVAKQGIDPDEYRSALDAMADGTLEIDAFHRVFCVPVRYAVDVSQIAEMHEAREPYGRQYCAVVLRSGEKISIYRSFDDIMAVQSGTLVLEP